MLIALVSGSFLNTSTFSGLLSEIRKGEWVVISISWLWVLGGGVVPPTGSGPSKHLRRRLMKLARQFGLKCVSGSSSRIRQLVLRSQGQPFSAS